jgi:BMFP domain-containing protein YqiC
MTNIGISCFLKHYYNKKNGGKHNLNSCPHRLGSCIYETSSKNDINSKECPMANENRLFDDLARVAGGAVSLISTVHRQIKSDVSSHLGDVAGRMDLADRQELDRLMAMVSKLRLEQEEMKKRLDAVEGKKPSVKKATPAKKPTVKQKPKKKK